MHSGGESAEANRRRIYMVLLDDPAREWTVRALTAAVNTVGEGTVRDTFNRMLADGFLRPVPYRRALTAMLTDHGKQSLTRLLRGVT
ncbi:hypothetical protein [Micromonospora sp. NPDC049107]|uniref:hypothetical protein n=1 Tax=unclassified Micromonospora TaxID=2617518 RepID=UPI003400C31A